MSVSHAGNRQVSIVWTANIETLVCCSLLVDTPDGYMLHEWWKVGCTVHRDKSCCY